MKEAFYMTNIRTNGEHRKSLSKNRKPDGNADAERFRKFIRGIYQDFVLSGDVSEALQKKTMQVNLQNCLFWGCGFDAKLLQ